MSDVDRIQGRTGPVRDLGVVEGKVNLSIGGVEGLGYVVEHTANLTAAQWEVVAEIEGVGATPYHISLPATNATGFYRVRTVGSTRPPQ